MNTLWDPEAGPELLPLSHEAYGHYEFFGEKKLESIKTHGTAHRSS